MKLILYLDNSDYSNELKDFVLNFINNKLEDDIKNNISLNIISSIKSLSNYQNYDNKHENLPSFLNLTPALVLEDNGTTIIYNAVPKNREEKSFLKTIKTLYTKDVALKKEVLERIKKISRRMKIEVFITTTCPYCPKIVEKINYFAILNSNIVPTIIDAEHFMEYSSKKGVKSVPHVIIDGKLNIVGSTNEEELSIRLIEAKYLF